MRILWYIAKKDLLQVYKDKSGLLLMLAVPLVLIAVVGFALGNFYGNGTTQIKVTVALNNQDTAPDAYVGKAIASALNVNSRQLVISVNQYTDPYQVRNQVTASNNAADVGIVIPSGVSQVLNSAVQQGSIPENLVQFYTLPNNNDARITIVRDIVNKTLQSQLVAGAAVEQVYVVCHKPGNSCTQSTIDAAVIAAAIQRANTASEQAVQSVTAGQATRIGPFDQTVPGYAIFFALFGLNAVAATILQEKEDGTFRRLLIAPIQKYALLGGKMLAQFLVTLAQLGVLFLVGYFVFKMHIGDWLAVIFILIGTSFAATGLGILLVALVRTRGQINPVVSLVTLITSAIGGAWWPLFLEPGWMQQLAKVGITAWAMEGLNGTMIFGKSFIEVLPDILGLLVYGLICFVIALKFFRFQQSTTAA